MIDKFIIFNCHLCTDNENLEHNLIMFSKQSIISINSLWNIYIRGSKPINISFIFDKLKIPIFHDVNIYDMTDKVIKIENDDNTICPQMVICQKYEYIGTRNTRYEKQKSSIAFISSIKINDNNLLKKIKLYTQFKKVYDITIENFEKSIYKNFDIFNNMIFNNKISDEYLINWHSDIYLKTMIPWLNIIEDWNLIWIPNIKINNINKTHKKIWTGPAKILLNTDTISSIDNYDKTNNKFDGYDGLDIELDKISPNLNKNSKYIPIHDELYNYENWSKLFLTENFKQQYAKKKLQYIEPTQCKDLFEFEMFTPLFCKYLIEECENYGNWSGGNVKESTPYDDRINNNENHPTQDIHLKQIGLGDIWIRFVKEYIAFTASQLYSNIQTSGVNIAFVVKYHMSGQKSLEPHHDASVHSTVTCLNKNFTGGGTYFVRQNYLHQATDIGYTSIHPGRCTHYHAGAEIKSGVRYVLISFNE